VHVIAAKVSACQQNYASRKLNSIWKCCFFVRLCSTSTDV